MIATGARQIRAHHLQFGSKEATVSQPRASCTGEETITKNQNTVTEENTHVIDAGALDYQWNNLGNTSFDEAE